MGEVRASETVHIDRPAAEVLSVLRDIAAQHEWWPGQYRSEVLETDRYGRVTRAVIGNDVKVAKDDFEVEYHHAPKTAGYSWVLASDSSVQRDQSGSWTLAPADGGTDVTLALALDAKLPLPGFLLKKTVKDTVHGAVTGLKKRCEA
ncbi:SRPBCC family protein [Actinomycetota bacterium]